MRAGDVYFFEPILARLTPDGGQVDDCIDVFHRFQERIGITNVAAKDGYAARGAMLQSPVPQAAHSITGGSQSFDDGPADAASGSGY
jgi:hypothetical protein